MKQKRIVNSGKDIKKFYPDDVAEALGAEKIKFTYNNIMLDLEMLGDDFITQIGAVYFNWDGDTGIDFLVNVSIADNLQRGAKVDAGNLNFWLDNCDKISWRKDAETLNKALYKFTEFCHRNKKALVWSHYSDIYVIQTVCAMLGQKIPFPFRNWRSIRTLVSLSDYHTKKEKGVDPKNHCALDDCYYQIDYVTKAYGKLKEVQND